MKKILALIMALLMVLSLCACGASATEAATVQYKMASPAEAPAAAEEYAYYDEAESYGGFATNTDAGLMTEKSESTPSENPEKIIYSANAELETLDFDTTVEALGKLVEEYGGYIQSSSVNGSNYYNIQRGYSYLRSANYTIRVPSAKFAELMNQLPTIGNVPYSYTYQENVTSQYYDVAAHKEAYETQEQTLLELMEKAESIDDIIAIESRLAEVRYQIESLQSTLNSWDRQVNYSTVDINVQEVEDYTPGETVSVTYGEKLQRAMRRGITSVGDFFSDLLLFIVEALPTLVLLGVVVAAVIIVIKRGKAKRGAKKAQTQKQIEEK